jgi:DNA-directed RNA polymerase I subunit RPA12
MGALCFCVATDMGYLDDWPVIHTSQSRPDAFPSTLHRRLRTLTQEVPEDIEVGTKVQQDCPNCSNDEMVYTGKQLRGADEGTTIFYHCTKCQYRYNENN